MTRRPPRRSFGGYDIKTIVGVTGLSGSGKTTLAQLLSEHMSASLISQDDFYIGCTAMRAAGQSGDNFDTLDAINCKGLTDTLDAICDGKRPSIEVPNYDHVRSAPNGFRNIVNSDVIIVEGHLLFTSDRILSYVDFLIYIDIDEEIAKERRFARDVVERGYTLEDCESYYMEYVESQLESIGDLKSKADYIIGNHVLKDVLNDHVETLSALLTK